MITGQQPDYKSTQAHGCSSAHAQRNDEREENNLCTNLRGRFLRFRGCSKSSTGIQKHSIKKILYLLKTDKYGNDKVSYK